MTNRMGTLILVAVIAILVIAACGSDSEAVPSLTSLEDGPAAEPTADAADATLDNEARMMAFAQCLRDQGIDVRDPVVDADGNVQMPELAGDVKWDKEGSKAAWEACAEHLEGLTFEKERVDMSEYLDQALALATCLRDKGYDVDDPTAETLDQWRGSFKDAINWDDPRQVADFEDCSGEEAAGTKGK
jgi:hypothetical protein